MLQIQVLRQSPEIVKAKLGKRHFKEIELIDTIISLDDELKKTQTESESLQAKINSLSKETGMLMAKKEIDKANLLKDEVIVLKNTLAPLAEKLGVLEEKIKNALVTIPNLPSDKVPEGKTPEENKIIREGGIKPNLPPNALPHWDLIKKYGLVDFETGAKINLAAHRPLGNGSHFFAHSCGLRQLVNNLCFDQRGVHIKHRQSAVAPK